MGFTNFLTSLFGNKSSRDMKLIQPFVEKIKAQTPKVEGLDNDALRARTKEIRQYVQAAASEQKAEIEQLKSTIEQTPLDERAEIFAKVDKLEKEALEGLESALQPSKTAAFHEIRLDLIDIPPQPADAVVQISNGITYWFTR